MNIVVVDNRPMVLKETEALLMGLFPRCSVKTFADPLMSAKYICNNHVDVAFVECELRPVDGETLLRVLKKHRPHLPIVLISERREQCVAVAMPDVRRMQGPITTEKMNALRDVFPA